MHKAIALLLLVAASVPAWAAGQLDGTWAGGWQDGHGVQIVVANDKLIAFNRDGQDYVETRNETLAPGGGALSFTWNQGDAMLIRDAKGARLLLHDKGKPEVTIPLKRD